MFIKDLPGSCYDWLGSLGMMQWSRERHSKEASRKQRGHCSNAGESGGALGCMEEQDLKRMVGHREALRSRRLAIGMKVKKIPKFVLWHA